jgi:hypothetical protein
MENPLLSPVGETFELDTSAIWSVRFIDPSGYECQLSLDARTGIDALNKAQLAIEKLKEIKCSPVLRAASITATKSSDKDEDHQCPIHDVVMRRWEKNGKVWYAHKFNDHWCRGK